MERKEYNGWTNYETWNAKLWMDNDQGTQEYWADRAEDCFGNAEAGDSMSREENAALALKDELSADAEERAEEWMRDQSSMFADFLNAALSEVNWYEIAKSLIDECEQVQA